MRGGIEEENKRSRQREKARESSLHTGQLSS